MPAKKTLMKRKECESIGSLLPALLVSNPKLADSYRKHKVVSQWRDISGEYVANATENMTFEGKKLVVKVKSSIIRNEMMLIRSQLVYRINNWVKADLIDELIVR